MGVQVWGSPYITPREPLNCIFLRREVRRRVLPASYRLISLFLMFNITQQYFRGCNLNLSSLIVSSSRYIDCRLYRISNDFFFMYLVGSSSRVCVWCGGFARMRARQRCERLTFKYQWILLTTLYNITFLKQTPTALTLRCLTSDLIHV